MSTASSLGTKIVHNILDGHFQSSKWGTDVGTLIRASFFALGAYLAFCLVQADICTPSHALGSFFWSGMIIYITGNSSCTSIPDRERDDELQKQLREFGEQISSVKSSIDNLSEKVDGVTKRQDCQLDGLELVAMELATQGFQLHEMVEKEFISTRHEIHKIQDGLAVTGAMVANISKIQAIHVSETVKIQRIADAKRVVEKVAVNFEGMRKSFKTISCMPQSPAPGNNFESEDKQTQLSPEARLVGSKELEENTTEDVRVGDDESTDDSIAPAA